MLSKAEMEKIALTNTSNASKPGLTPTQVVNYYSDWAKESKYEQQYTDEMYKGPKVVATAVSYHLAGRTNVSVLDVAAGTGLVAVQLKMLGFNTIDAIEPSEGMVEIAKEKNIYRNIFKVFFTNDVPCIKSSEYNVVVCSGGFMDGHLRCDALKEMVRCVKKGGLVVMVLREEFLQTVAEYKERLEPYMRQLETDRHWVLVDKTIFPNYFGPHNGIRFVFKVTKTENGAS